MSLAIAIAQIMLAPNYGPIHSKEIAKDNAGMTKHRRAHAESLHKLLIEMGAVIQHGKTKPAKEETLDSMLEQYRHQGNKIDRCLARKICEQMVEEKLLHRRKMTVRGRPRVFYSAWVKA